MSNTRMPAGEFNHYPARARRLAHSSDVIVERRGQPDVVVVSWERYQRLTGGQGRLVDAIADPDSDHVDLELPHIEELPRSVEL